MGAMKKYRCVCGWVYDPEMGDPVSGIPPGTRFEDLPRECLCPVCLAGTDYFREMEGIGDE